MSCPLMFNLTLTEMLCLQTSVCTTSSKTTAGASSSVASSQTTVSVSTSSATTAKPAVDPKPVECNLCHRKFKNIPALNGHMRLHGGYFKKVITPCYSIYSFHVNVRLHAYFAYTKYYPPIKFLTSFRTSSYQSTEHVSSL